MWEGLAGGQQTRLDWAGVESEHQKSDHNNWSKIQNSADILLCEPPGDLTLTRQSSHFYTENRTWLILNLLSFLVIITKKNSVH